MVPTTMNTFNRIYMKKWIGESANSEIPLTIGIYSLYIQNRNKRRNIRNNCHLNYKMICSLLAKHQLIKLIN